jgi:chemotaxis protein methyltransferase CheR
MMPQESPMLAERFRAVVADRLGLQFDDAKLGYLEEVLHRRADALGKPAAAYLGDLEAADRAHGEFRALAVELTVNETYFFRNPDQFRALTQAVLPARLSLPGATRHLRILSAGCASGEEAYSLVIALRETLPDPSWTFTVRAVDINPAMLDKARRGRYSAWSLRETPNEARRRWFRSEGAEFRIDEGVRDAVEFEERNLVEDDADLWKPQSYDVVFCRNVIMYFPAQTAQAVVGRIARALAPDGHLFLGHAETLRGLSQDFHLEHTHDTFYYRVRSGQELARPQATRAIPAAAATADLDLLPEIVDDSATWVDAIRRASERIQALSEASAQQSPGERPAARAAPKVATHRAQLLDLLEKERFDDALVLAGALPGEAATDPQMLLLRAALLTHAGKFAEAEPVCHELLRQDEMNGEAHYLLALCREGAGDPAAAADYDRIAVYLDPAFAMPRLHLGLLARRAGRRDAARLDFSRALVLLQQEDASRLLLFGGGFGREALVALCQAELAACGGAP